MLFVFFVLCGHLISGVLDLFECRNKKPNWQKTG